MTLMVTMRIMTPLPLPCTLAELKQSPGSPLEIVERQVNLAADSAPELAIVELDREIRLVLSRRQLLHPLCNVSSAAFVVDTEFLER